MLLPVEKYIQDKLERKKSEHNFRQLTNTTGLIDFTSNDYLGFAKSESLKAKTTASFSKNSALKNGSTGSRLLSGNSSFAEELEQEIAAFHGADSALLFNSGFDANYGLFSTLPYKGDTVLYDEAVHASIHDGMRNNKAHCVSFLHNDVADLEAKLQQATGIKYVVVESLYSMNGDFSPLVEVAALCEKYKAALVVDEAHTLGIFGATGSGRVCELGLEKKCFARVMTYGKAAGAAGASIIGSISLKDFLINYCRPFIFSTAMLPYQLVAIANAYQQMPLANNERQKLDWIIQKFSHEMNAAGFAVTSAPNSPIQIISLSGNEKVVATANYLQKNGFDVRPIKHPTVPKGNERLRICLHCFNTEQEVVALAQLIHKHLHA